MSLRTNNSYGVITITDEVVAAVAGRIALDCYGVVEKTPRTFSDIVADIFRKKSEARGVRVVTKGDRIFLDLYVILKYGLPISAVCDALKSSVKYGVEQFTGMIVDTINVHVVGIKSTDKN